jgi:hypothetical protein
MLTIRKSRYGVSWARRGLKAMKHLVTAVAFAFLAILAPSCSSRSDTPTGDTPPIRATPPASSATEGVATLKAPHPRAASKSRASTTEVVARLEATEVVATLETPIPKGKNAVWCASFLAAWKTLAEQTAPEPPALAGSGGLCASLNNALDPRPAIPPAALYVASGWIQHGIIEQIQRELAQKFPSKQPPTFPGAIPDPFIVYSYLEANVKFSLPYFENRRALEFTDSAGRKTKITSFGIRPEDDFAYHRLRAQPRILFHKALFLKGGEKDWEFAIDLCADSKPSQIVVARINREPTLAAAIARVERDAIDVEKRERDNPPHILKSPFEIGVSDVLLVPNLLWQLSHHFSDVEGKGFINTRFKGRPLTVAQQDITFRLDRSGAELQSESKMVVMCGPGEYIVDRPFLIYMIQRGSKIPYFALWIDNAELLSKWPNRGSAQSGGSTPPRDTPGG